MWNILDTKKFKQSVVTAFDATKKGYGSNGDFHWLHAKKVVELAHIEFGQQVLDVATGTAPAAIMAAQLVGPKGHVTGQDISPGMLEQARYNIEQANLTNVISLFEGDAEDLMFEDNSFDILLCASAVPWFPVISKAFSEFYRVLKSNGYIVFSCWGGEAKVTRSNILNEILLPYGQTTPELNGRINSPEKCQILLQAAGFKNVKAVLEDKGVNFIDPEKDFIQNWPGISSRFNVNIADEEIENVKSKYIKKFQELEKKSLDWNLDYTQFITAEK